MVISMFWSFFLSIVDPIKQDTLWQTLKLRFHDAYESAFESLYQQDKPLNARQPSHALPSHNVYREDTSYSRNVSVMYDILDKS